MADEQKINQLQIYAEKNEHYARNYHHYSRVMQYQQNHPSANLPYALPLFHSGVLDTSIPTRISLEIVNF